MVTKAELLEMIYRILARHFFGLREQRAAFSDAGESETRGILASFDKASETGITLIKTFSISLMRRTGAAAIISHGVVQLTVTEEKLRADTTRAQMGAELRACAFGDDEEFGYFVAPPHSDVRKTH
jgi:hypothetical protein